MYVQFTSYVYEESYHREESKLDMLLTCTVALINLIKLHYYCQYVDNIFALHTSPEHLEALRTFPNGRHSTMSLTIEREKQN